MSDETLIAVFIDFENLALGVKEQERNDFRIDLVLKRLLEKGRVVYKRAYCDWSRFRGVTRNLHAHGITMVDIPENKISGKNSADIHMVVDALDLAHIKPHIDVFALLSGDSDFSPLVSKLKENNKRVIGLGVKTAPATCSSTAVTNLSTTMTSCVWPKTTPSGRGGSAAAAAATKRVRPQPPQTRVPPKGGARPRARSPACRPAVRRRRPTRRTRWTGPTSPSKP